MPHGLPDFGASTPKETVFALSDMAELAVRLGSVVSYDRRGDVVYIDDFESPVIKWTQALIGVGAAINLSAAIARSGSQSLFLRGGTVAGASAGITRNLPTITPKRMGAEITFSLNRTSIEWRWDILYYDGTNYHQGTMKFIDPTHKLQLLNGAGVYIDLATIALTSGIVYQHTLKLVVDFSTDKYVRFMLDDRVYDISSYDLRVSASAIGPLLLAGYSVDAVANGPINDVYLDDFIFTQNEP